MRQDAPSNPTPSAALAMLVALTLVFASSGCQLAPTSPTIPSQRSRDAERSKAATALSPAARVRGQSGDGWSAATTNGTDSQRKPMRATDVSRSTPAYLASGSQGNPLLSTTVLQPPSVGTYGQAAAPAFNGYLPIAPLGAQGYPAYAGQGGYDVAGAGGPPLGNNVPGAFGSAIAPGVSQPLLTNEGILAPGVYPGGNPSFDPTAGFNPDFQPGYQPRERVTPLEVYLQERRSGRILFGGTVNSDLGVAGQVILEERNFDIRAWPRSWNDPQAFYGDGQDFRVELMPGDRVQRYTVGLSTRNLLGYLPYNFSVGGFYYTRQLRDWTEQRAGGRVSIGYFNSSFLSLSSELRLEDVKIFEPRIGGVADLERALGSNDVYTARFRIARDSRDSPFLTTEGSLLELVYDQVFGEYDYPRGQINFSRYFRVNERQSIASTWKVGITGAQTPIFENYFAGGYSTLRGFSFRGASPKDGDVQVGGELSLLGSLEYVFPLTADEMLRGVAFVDYGTVERDLKISSENIRVAPGLGLRVSIPALGPAPLAFDFAYPINQADSDERKLFSFFLGATR